MDKSEQSFKSVYYCRIKFNNIFHIKLFCTIYNYIVGVFDRPKTNEMVCFYTQIFGPPPFNGDQENIRKW